MRFTQRLVDAGVAPSTGSTGDSFDYETPSRRPAARLLLTTDPEVWVSLLLICRPPGGAPVVLAGRAVTSVVRSDKPEARSFRRWVTQEVLPAIRRTGTYSTAAPPSPLDVLDAMVDTLRARGRAHW